MPHICHLSTTFNRRSGSARRTAAILAACVERGYRVSLIAGGGHDLASSSPESSPVNRASVATWSQGDLPGVTVEVVPELVKPIRPLSDAVAAIRLGRLLRRLAPDLVHTHLAKAGILGRLTVARAGVPRLVHTVHGPTFPGHLPAVTRGLFRALESYAARRTDAMVYVGEELRQSYLAQGVGCAASSRVIRTCQPAGHLAFRPPAPDRRQALRHLLCGGETCEMLLVHVGRLVPAKRPEHAIAVLEGLRERGLDARLVLVGEALLAAEKGTERRLRELAGRSPAAGRIHFAGFRRDVVATVSCADALLLTSRHEGLPNVAVEAVLAGTPVVGYAVTGLAEVVGDSGRMVTEGGPAALVEALIELDRDRVTVRRRLAERRQWVAGEYTRQRMIDATLTLYQELLP